MNDTTDMINNQTTEQIKGVLGKSIDFLSNSANSVGNFLQGFIPQTWMVKILLIIVGVGCVFVGSKVTQNLSKFILYVLGTLLVLGTIFSLFS